MNSYFGNATTFIIDALMGFYILLVLLRFWFQMVRTDFYNPVSQMIVKLTNPPLKILRRFIPSMGKFDTASLVLLLLLATLKIFIIFQINGHSPSVVGVFVLALADTLVLAGYVLFFAVLILVILSWVAPRTHNPVVRVVHDIANPFLGPVRRAMPSLGGLDFSPVIILLGLGVLQRLIAAPLFDLASRLL